MFRCVHTGVSDGKLKILNLNVSGGVQILVGGLNEVYFDIEQKQKMSQIH